jgi:hypothetical protein
VSTFPPDLARRVAERLAAETDPNLPALTERLLADGPEASAKPQTYDAGTAIALAALLLGVAQFAWAIYRDLRKDRQEAQEKPRTTSHRELLHRRMRLEFHDRPGVSTAQRDRLFEVVVDEVMLLDGDG